MLTTCAAQKFFAVALPSTYHGMKKPTICFGPTNKRQNLSHLKNSGIRAADMSSPTEGQEINSSYLEINKQLPVSNMVDNRKARQLNDMIAELPNYEILLEIGLVFQQNFTIRSFDIGTDFKLSIEGLMNYLKETTVGHLEGIGVLAGGFGLTKEMIARNLVWVRCRYHIQVDFYPSWRDDIQIDTWMYTLGKAAIHRDLLIRDSKTGRTLIRATSLYMMMNKKTRKSAKLSEDVIGELKPFLLHCDPIIQKDSRKLVHLEADEADYVRKSLTAVWTDMDANQHVSHIRLARYALESVPRSVVESHELSAMTLEYRNECNGDSVLQSLSKIISNTSTYPLEDNEEVEFDHSLDLECGPEILRGRTMWKHKYAN